MKKAGLIFGIIWIIVTIVSVVAGEWRDKLLRKKQKIVEERLDKYE